MNMSFPLFWLYLVGADRASTREEKSHIRIALHRWYMYNMYGSAVGEEDYELLMLIADEMTSNILHIIWHINTPSALHCIHRAMCTMNEAAPFVPGANDIMKRGFSRSEWYVDRPHVPKLQSRFVQKKSRKSSVKKTQK